MLRFETVKRKSVKRKYGCNESYVNISKFKLYEINALNYRLDKLRMTQKKQIFEVDRFDLDILSLCNEYIWQFALYELMINFDMAP